jgi:hemoglobin
VAPTKQRLRWINRLAKTADEVLLPDDPDARQAFLSYLEWGSRIAVFNSQPGVQPIAHAPVPQWGWGNSAPFVPQPWDDPDAAAKGRERYVRKDVR